MSDEQKQVAFNVVRAAFWLITSIIWASIVYSFFLTGICAVGVFTGAVPAGNCREFAPNVMELMVGGLSVAVAFMSKDTTK